ncbi:MAG TPA: glycosyltransferase [Gaiellaceae bacterium]
MRICLVYDHLFPQTVGGAERWMRDLAVAVAARGHDVTYLTMRHGAKGETQQLPGVRVVGLTSAGRVYGEKRRSIGPPLRFGVAVAQHLATHGSEYDVVHTASFPYFPVLAAAGLRRRGGYELVVDWHEVWTREYWRRYAGRGAGTAGWLVQRKCIRVAHTAYCMSQLHARRLVTEGYRGTPTVLPGLYAGSAGRVADVQVDPALVVYAGRHVPEKRVDALVRGFARALTGHPELQLEIYGDGPERTRIDALVRELGLASAVRVLGQRTEQEVAEAMARSACVATASEREGYGLVVVEAAALGTPSVVVAGPENAATELVREGVNGAVAESSAPDRIAAALTRVVDAGPTLRTSTARWFADNRSQLEIERSLDLVLEGYERQSVGAGLYSRTPF